MLARVASKFTRRPIYVLKYSSTLSLKYPRRIGPEDMGIGNPVCERFMNMGMGLELQEAVSLMHLAMVSSSNYIFDASTKIQII